MLLPIAYEGEGRDAYVNDCMYTFEQLYVLPTVTWNSLNCNRRDYSSESAIHA